jgi:flagellar secretion chaperone FliS
MVAQHYARTYRANAVLTASPGQLVLMLFDGALKSLALARAALAAPEDDFRRYAVANEQLLKAQQIIGELQDSLNMDAGDGALAREMFRLYDYYNRRLFEANLRKQPEPVVEVEKLLTELRAVCAEMLAKSDSTRADFTQGFA